LGKKKKNLKKMTSFVPQKTRELHTHHFDSTKWNDFPFRDTDIVIGTYAKSGTTLVQWIVFQLLHGGADTTADGTAMPDASPWVDLRFPPRDVLLAALEAQTSRRVLKTHLPLDALVFSPKVKYVYVVRDGRDVAMSLHHHHSVGNDAWYAALNNPDGLVGPPLPKPDPNPSSYFADWLSNDGAPFWSFFENVSTWWQARALPNVKILHFSDLKADLPGKMREIATFLDIPIDEATFPRQVERCTFDWMKAHAELMTPLGGQLFEGGAQSFINKGTNKRWVDVISPDDSARYERIGKERLGEECALFLNR
jgi:aryl sulfotransferase